MSPFEGNLIVFGGKNGQDITLNELWVYNSAKDMWTEIVYNNIVTNVPKPKYLVSGCLVERYGVILFFGGRHTENNSIYFLNLNILSELLQMQNTISNPHDNVDYVAKLNKLWTIKSDTSIFFDLI